MSTEMDIDSNQEELLQPPTEHEESSTLERLTAPYYPLTSFELSRGDAKHYKQQFGDMYFLRLAKLKPAVERIAKADWHGYQIAGDTVHQVERVLDVRQGELCWVTGTVYMDMLLKPNILEDISKDHWVTAQPLREKYKSTDGSDKVMLEDESGRLRLIGIDLDSQILVTGCIISVMGTENANGDFEVIDIKIPDLPQQPARWELRPNRSTVPQTEEVETGKKVAFVSGLAITGESGDMLALELLVEWLLGEATSGEMQQKAAQITRLVIAGDSLAEPPSQAIREQFQFASAGTKRAAQAKKYGYDSSTYNPAPTTQFDQVLSTLLPSLPITLLPGSSDPANVSMPQQPLHPALFSRSRAYAAVPRLSESNATKSTNKKPQFQPEPIGWFHPTTNPAFFTLAGQLFLGNGGQPIEDIGKYIDLPESTCPSLDLMEHTLRWRLLAPTAPDTLWCYPYQFDDPFVLNEGLCPHVYFAGNQPTFGTRIIEGSDGQKVRLISIPAFKSTGEVILVDLETLEVEVVKLHVHDPTTLHVARAEG